MRPGLHQRPLRLALRRVGAQPLAQLVL